MRPICTAVLSLAICACGGGKSEAPLLPNNAPTAKAGPDMDVVERATIVLDGSKSNDIGGTISSYLWNQTSGPSVVISSANSAMAAFDTPPTVAVLQIGFELTVTDDRGAIAKDDVIVNVNPNLPPTLDINFPCDGCRVIGDRISVTGTVSSDPDSQIILGGDDILITVSTVAGVVVATPDNSGKWIAQGVPIPSSGTISLDVVAEDHLGETDLDTVRVENMVTFTGGLLAMDSITLGRFYILEQHHLRDRVVDFDQANNTYRIVYEAAHPTLVADFGQPWNMSLDARRGRLIVFGRGTDDPVVAVDLTTGDTTVLSGASAGAGVDFIDPRIMDIDEDDNRAIVFDRGHAGILIVDLDSGDRSLIAPTGIAEANAMTVDSANDILYFQYQGITAFDLNTGDATIVGDPAFGSLALSMDYDSIRSLVLGVSSRARTISAFNPATSNDDLIINIDSPGAALLSPRYGRVDIVGDRYIVSDLVSSVSDLNSGTLVEIDPITGDRQVWFDNGIGNGPKVARVMNISIDAASDSVYLISAYSQSLMRVNLITKDREVVSGGTTGTGPALLNIRDVTVDGDGNVAYVYDQDLLAILSIDLTNGNRTIISDVLNGSGPLFEMPTAMDIDPDTDVLYIVDAETDSLLTVDVVTGDRVIISDSSTPGRPFDFPSGIDMDLASGQIYVSDEGNGSTTSKIIFSIDVSTGERRIVSQVDVAGVGNFDFGTRDVQVDPVLNLAFSSQSALLTKVDLSNGNRAVLSDWETGNGEANWNLQNITYDSGSHTLYGYDSNFGALFAVDVLTGDRVVVSR